MPRLHNLRQSLPNGFTNRISLSSFAARQAGASVILVETENRIGGHAITSCGSITLGAGTSVQEKCGAQDSPGLLFRT
jgi:hypothetical protein